MFTIQEIREAVAGTKFSDDYLWVKQSLVNKRANQNIEYELEKTKRLEYFLECVFASCYEWSYDESVEICRTAAEIAETIADCDIISDNQKLLFRLKSSLLYELSGYSALSQALIEKNDFDELTSNFFKRLDGFNKLKDGFKTDYNFYKTETYIHPLIDAVLRQDAFNLLVYEQGYSEINRTNYSSIISELAKKFYLPLNASELKTLSYVLDKRAELATIANVSPELFQSLQKIGFPTELWPAQLKV